MKLPNDPVMLMSVINTKLRDGNDSLDEICKSFDIDKNELISKLCKAGFKYMPDINQFR